jgi:hypothetical protein
MAQISKDSLDLKLRLRASKRQMEHTKIFLHIVKIIVYDN